MRNNSLTQEPIIDADVVPVLEVTKWHMEENEIKVIDECIVTSCSLLTLSPARRQVLKNIIEKLDKENKDEKNI